MKTTTKTTIFQKAATRYRAPVPIVLEVWGDVIVTIGAGMQVVLAVEGVDYKWSILNALFTVIGRVLPKFTRLYVPPDELKE